MRSDVCAYIEYKNVKSLCDRFTDESDKVIIGMMTVRVYDILYLGAKAEYRSSLVTIGGVRRGDVTISTDLGLLFCCADFEYRRFRLEAFLLARTNSLSCRNHWIESVLRQMG